MVNLVTSYHNYQILLDTAKEINKKQMNVIIVSFLYGTLFLSSFWLSILKKSLIVNPLTTLFLWSKI